MFPPVSWFGSEALVDPGTYTFNNLALDIVSTGQNGGGCVSQATIFGSNGSNPRPPADIEFFRGNGGQPPGSSFSTYGDYDPAEVDPDVEVRWSWTVVVLVRDPGPGTPTGFNEGGGFNGFNGVFVPLSEFTTTIQFGINAGSTPEGFTDIFRVNAVLTVRNTVTGRIGSTPTIVFRGTAQNGPPF